MRLKESTQKSNKTFMFSQIKHIIDTFGKRPPGSEGERRAQEYYAEELKSYADKVTVEDFDVYPKSFMDWIYITVAFWLLGFAAYFFIPALAIVFVIIGTIPMVSQLVLYKTWFDKLFKKQTSCNVYATKAPQGEVKRRIIFAGHTDATWEWHWHYKFGFKGLAVVIVGSVLGGIYMLIASIVSLACGNVVGVVSGAFTYIGISFVPFALLWLAALKFSDYNQVVDGANDNLSACAVAFALIKAFDEDGIRLQNTELGIMMTGSEEAGLRGAKAFAKKHAAELNTIPTYIVNLETLRDLKYLSIITRDVNATVKNDMDVAELIKKSAKNCGFDLGFSMVEVGGTDAAAFVQGGLKAATLAAMNHNLEDYYHTRRDTYDNLNPEVMSKVLDICAEAAMLFDEQAD